MTTPLKTQCCENNIESNMCEPYCRVCKKPLTTNQKSVGEVETILVLKEKFKMSGDYGKLTPFQETVNTYIENRAQEILTALNNQPEV